jgi:hypothetical protein
MEMRRNIWSFPRSIANSSDDARIQRRLVTPDPQA